MGVFSKNHYPNNKPSRNTFDLSHRNHLTLDFGSLIPVLCQEVIPGDTFEINTDFLLRFMPLAFPVQTQIRADIHYFYVRNRNLWEDWMNFIGMTGDTSKISMPQIVTGDSIPFKTKSLADYLGIPTTVTGANETDVFSVDDAGGSFNQYGTPPRIYIEPSTFLTDNPIISSKSTVANTTYRLTRKLADSNNSANNEGWLHNYFTLSKSISFGNIPKDTLVRFRLQVNSLVDDFSKLRAYVLTGNDFTPVSSFGLGTCSKSSVEPFDIEFTFRAKSDFGGSCYLFIFSADAELTTLTRPETTESVPQPIYGTPIDSFFSSQSLMQVSYSIPSVREWNKSFPVGINALPFRAYESIYNAFYRDNRNNPYLVNGVNDPNVYIPSKKGGSDQNVYEIHRRNWEQDFLTSAVPSPQQGVAPLVGLTSTGVASYSSDDGTIYNVKMNTAEDGDTIVSADITSNLPNDVKRSVVEVASQGISINDFRGVNALQCWLERNMRNGLKYKDQIASHFGVEPSYAELDMPEFIGGVSQIVDVQQINQTAPSDGDPLGSYAGQAYAFGSSKHKVRHYCDEHGYIIGILSVVPVPSYSQLLPKHFTKTQPLDYFTPEFGHIGMQPIPYKEVCPLQAKYHNVGLNSTFGYQRAWYDYLANFDQVHGEFRTSLRDFILQRQFDTVPSLNPEFLLVSSSQLNDIFTVNEVPDSQGNMIPVQPILGAIQFDIKAKRPIPRFGIPRLE